MEDRKGGRVSEDRIDALMADAGAFFEECLWESVSGEAARELLAERGLDEKVLREFGVGYSPVGPTEYMEHLRDLDYTDDELVAAGLATRSPRGRAHAHFRSRVMFPVRNRKGRVLGFAGMATHVGPSWALWVTSPDAGPYVRAQAVFGIDRASKRIAASKTAVVLRDSIEVLIAHQDGKANAVTVHTGSVTPLQLDELAAGIKGGTGALELDLGAGMTVEPEEQEAAAAAPARRLNGAATAEPPRYLELKKLSLVIATGVAAMNTWTGAPLLAVWLGAQSQGGQVLSLRGVVTVLVVVGILEYLLAVGLTWLSAKYDELTGRPRLAGQTSPWHRAKRGDRVQDIRAKYGISPPERVVAACVIAALIALEVWFFFYAGAPF